MKIKSVEIVGFKSFLEKTHLSFLPGITAMVGPNGCGKSNVVDAIRWALGEQSAKHLRGSLMEDVIFNGSKGRKPLGMAEVSLTFSNENGGTPIPGNVYTEMEITRRVFRSGESEYFINKTPCRLKDITEMFLDTGVGTRAYSIIEQGRVEAIINSKPSELRVLIEEAAGISKYKVRKQEALRKMDATRQNLLRVQDVLGEIERQISSLKYQAKKLKMFKGLKERIKRLDLALASEKHTALLKHQSLKKAELQDLQDSQAALMAAINVMNADIVSKKTLLQEAEERFVLAERKKLEIEFSIKEEENQIERKKEKIEDLKNQSTKAAQEMEQHQSRLREEEEEIEKAQALKTQLEGSIQELGTYLKGEDERLAALKEDFAAMRNDLEIKKEELFTTRYEISRRENSISNGEQSRDECRRRLKQNHAETETARTQLEELKTQKSTILEEMEKHRYTKELLEKEQASHQELCCQLDAEIKDITESIAATKEKQARCESQLESLQELQKNYEGCSDGVRSIMQRKHELEKTRNGIYGLVADFVETEPHLEVAVESVLGEKLQYVIVRSHAEGIEAVEYLKTQSLGRGSFVPIETGKEFPICEQQGSTLPSGITPLISTVKTKEDYQPIVSYLLGNTFLVEDLAQALSIWENTDFPCKLVTKGGEIIDSRGIITGGNKNGSGSGFLRKKREMKEIEHTLSSLVGQLETLQRTKEEKVKELEEERGLLHNSQETLIEEKLSFQNKERDLRQNTEEIQRIGKKFEFLMLEEKKLSGELAELEENLAISRAELENVNAQQQLLEERFSELQERERKCREEIDAEEEQVHGTRADLMELKGQLASLTATLELRKKALVNCRGEIAKCQKTHEEAIEEAAELGKSVETGRQRVDTMSIAYQRYQDELRIQASNLDGARGSLGENEEKLKALHQKLNGLQPSIQELDHEVTAIVSETRYLEETIGSKYHIALKEIAGHYPPEQYPEEETKAKLEKLEQAQERMIEGINFNAEREYEERIKQQEFYQTQSQDLNKALDSLQEAILRINRTSRERFRTTYHQVNENFKKILPSVFEGGQGELNLTDESDLLETGVEIMVQPAGKSLRHISLLSGGEKALSAISLLFALYLIKPSPFCLLDEVDSPLDDANIDRFVAILKEFAPSSQFILITHNKKTMEIADTLYGITMEEPGISKIVSVRLN